MKSSGHEGGGACGPSGESHDNPDNNILFVFYFCFLFCFGVALVGRTPVGSLKISYIYRS